MFLALEIIWLYGNAFASPVQGEVPNKCEAEGVSRQKLRIRITF